MRKLHFQGFCFAAIYWGSPTLGRLLLYQALRKVAFVASSCAATSWEIIGIASFFAAIHWGIPTCELFFCSMLLGKSNFLALCCFRVLRSHNSDMPGEVHRCEVGVILDWDQSIGDFHLQGFFCVEARREFRMPSFCAKLCEDFDCEVLFCFKRLRGYDSESYILNTPPPSFGDFGSSYILNTAPSCGDSGSSYILNTAPRVAIPVHHIS